MIYAVMIFITVGSSLFIKNIPEKQYNYGFSGTESDWKRAVCLFVGAIPLFLVSSLRFGIGTDYFFTYYPQFRIIYHNGESYYEKGFYYLNKLIIKFTANPQWLFVVTSFIFVALTFLCIYRHAINATYSVFLLIFSYAFFVSMNNIRQSLASAVLFFALFYLLDGKRVRFTILVCLAGLLHEVAFVYLLYLVIEHIKVNAKQLLCISAGVFVLGKVLGPIVMSVMMNVPRVSDYFDMEELAIYSENTISLTFLGVNACILLLYVVIEHISDIKDDNVWNIIIWTQFLALSVCAFDGMIPATYRVVRIFSFMQIFMVPMAIEKCKYRENRILFYLAVSMVYMVDFLNMFVKGAEEVVPYVSIFS